jgi:hypothetical protein
MSNRQIEQNEAIILIRKLEDRVVRLEAALRSCHTVLLGRGVDPDSRIIGIINTALAPEGAEEWKPPLGPSAGPLLDRIEKLERALLDITDCYTLRFGGNVTALKPDLGISKPFDIALAALASGQE